MTYQKSFFTLTSKSVFFFIFLILSCKKNQNTKDFKTALEYFELNIKKNNFLNSWVNKSNILLENEKYNEGLEFSKEAIKIYPKNLKIINNLANDN